MKHTTIKSALKSFKKIKDNLFIADDSHISNDQKTN